jgi:hypothetical protein
MTAAQPSSPPPRAAKQPIRSQGGGLALMISAPIAAALVFAVLYQAIDHEGILVMGAIGCFMLGWFGYDMGQRMRLPDGWEAMARDPRPPVLYLRPFAEDDRMTYDAPVGTRRGGVETSAGAKGSASHERAIARALRTVGPVIAVGKPGERIAPFGAARIYVSDAEWQDTVLSLIKRSALIVLQPEATQGTWWELNMVVRHVDARRVLMLVPDPSQRPLGYDRVRHVTAQVLSVALPEAPGKCNAVIFDEDARPITFPFGDKPEKTLEPFLARLRTLKGPAA